jgi:hypothetical protein
MTIVEDMAILRETIDRESEIRHEDAIRRREGAELRKQEIQKIIGDTRKFRREMVSGISGISAERKKEGEELRKELKEEKKRLKYEVMNFRKETDDSLKKLATGRKEDLRTLKKNLRDERATIKDEVFALRKETRDLKTETRKMIRELASERNNEADILMRKLKTENLRLKNENSENRKETKNQQAGISKTLKNTITGRLKEISESNSELRDNIHSLINNVKSEVGSNKTTRLQMHEAWLRNTGGNIPRATVNIQESREGEAGLPVTRMTEIGIQPEVRIISEEESLTGNPNPVVNIPDYGSVMEEVTDTQAGEYFDDLKSDIYNVIKMTETGVSLREIGNTLDIEWRKLIRPAKILLDEGTIKKVDLNYFPARTDGN